MSGLAAVFTATPSDDTRARCRVMSQRLSHRGSFVGEAGDDRLSAVSTLHHPAGLYRTAALVDDERTVLFDGRLNDAAGVLGTGEGANLPDAIWRGFRRHGERFLDRLDGSFAIVIHDRETDRFHFARDRFGHRPLLFVVVDGAVLVASEYRALLGDPALRPRVNERLLPDVLRLGLVLGPETLVTGVHKALPGHVLTLDGRREVTATSFVHPTVEAVRGRRLADVERFVEAELASTIRGYGDTARLGLLLSGGIDSAVLATILRAETRRGHGVSFGATNWPEEESGAAEAVAERVGLPFTRARAGADFDVVGHLRRAIWHIGEPTRFDNAVALEYTYAALAPHADAVLTGELGDTLLGEKEHRRARWLPLLWAVPAGLRAAVPAPGAANLGRGQRIVGHLRSESFGDYLRGTFAWAPGLADPAAPSPTRARLAELERSFGVGPVARYTLATVLGFWFPWLERMEQTGAAHGLDVVHPFQTNAMLEYALALPYRTKVRGTVTKPALRNLAARTFGEEFVDRPKKKLRAPMALWLDTSSGLRDAVLELTSGACLWRDYVDSARAEPFLADYAANGAGRKTTARAVFLLLSLEIWLRQTLAGDAPAGVSP